jgi:hypothetical protein
MFDLVPRERKKRTLLLAFSQTALPPETISISHFSSFTTSNNLNIVREFAVEITRTKYERGLFAELISLERASVPFGAVAQISQRSATFLRRMKNF